MTVPTQRAWGWDYLWPAMAKINGTSEAAAAEANIGGGGGGGFSQVEPTPSYQLFVSGTAATCCTSRRSTQLSTASTSNDNLYYTGNPVRPTTRRSGSASRT